MKKLLLLFALTFIMICCDKNCTTKIELSTNEDLLERFEIVDLIKSNQNHNDYIKNLDVLPGISYYNSSDEYIYIQTPIPNRNFFIKNCYYLNHTFYSVIFIHLTDNTSEETRRKPMRYLLNAQINYSDLENVYTDLPSFDEGPKGNVFVVIYNDDGTLSTAIFRPQESGGGVIIEGP